MGLIKNTVPEGLIKNLVPAGLTCNFVAVGFITNLCASSSSFLRVLRFMPARFVSKGLINNCAYGLEESCACGLD